MTAYGRVWRVTVGTLRVSEHRVAFDIERTLHARPGKANVRIWNLTRSQQTQVENAVGQQLVVEIGHERSRGLEQIFRGEVWRGHGGDQRANRTEVESRVDAVTHVEGRDGGSAVQQTRVDASFGPGASVANVVRSCAEALGVGIGNTAEAIAAATAEGTDTTFPEGTVLSGPPARELTRLLSSFGLRWSIQCGALQVLPVYGAIRTEAVRLAVGTGLVGEPERGTRGRVRATSIFTADLWPGRPVVLDHDRVSGRFVARSVRYTGDTRQQDWYAHAELRAA